MTTEDWVAERVVRPRGCIVSADDTDGVQLAGIVIDGKCFMTFCATSMSIVSVMRK